VQIFRFDPEVSAPVDPPDSETRVGKLTGEDTRGRIQILHLAPGDTIDQRSARQQLVAVISGSGWVGGEGARRSIRSGQAAVWEADELKEIGSDEGLTAVWVEGSFSMEAYAVTREILVVDWDPQWLESFERVRASLWPAIENIALRIEHVGSTSVPGLPAKPIIDIDIVVSDQSQVPQIIDVLAQLGYAWRGDLGVAGRQAFDTSRHPELPPHHLYLVVENSKAHLDHVLLRDVLLADPEERDRYAELKRTNVELAQGDIDVYTAAKARYVADLLTRARADRGLEPASYWIPDVPDITS
jgi:GrpB-like predicted nucleotidyltransferase (UPF0157 family)/quercetin dioxygenase-like cupin family protein